MGIKLALLRPFKAWCGSLSDPSSKEFSTDPVTQGGRFEPHPLPRQLRSGKLRRWGLSVGLLLLTIWFLAYQVFDYSTRIHERGTLVVWGWDGYFPESLHEKFYRETGFSLDVRWNDLPKDENVVEALLKGKPLPDLIMPSASVAKDLRDRNLIADFDPRLFPRPATLPITTASRYNPKFDPENQFVIPYAWGATGIGYDVDRVDGLPSSWSAIFEARPRRDERNTLIDRPLQRVMMLDNARFTLGSMLLYLGDSPNTTDAAAVHRAADRLVKLYRLAESDETGDRYYKIVFGEDEIPHLLRNGGLGLSMTWSADVTDAMFDLMREDGAGNEVVTTPGNPRVRLALPEEGSIVFRDSFMIPMQAHHMSPVDTGQEGEVDWSIDPAEQDQWQAVHQLIEFMLRPENAAVVTEYSKYATTVHEADAYIDPFITNGPSFMMHSSGKNQFLEVLDEPMRKAYQSAWENVKNNQLYAEVVGMDNAAKAPAEIVVELPEGGPPK